MGGTIFTTNCLNLEPFTVALIWNMFIGWAQWLARLSSNSRAAVLIAHPAHLSCCCYAGCLSVWLTEQWTCPCIVMTTFRATNCNYLNLELNYSVMPFCHSYIYYDNMMNDEQVKQIKYQSQLSFIRLRKHIFTARIKALFYSLELLQKEDEVQHWKIFWIWISQL